MRRLVSSGANLFVAGDDDESIYSFRHANPENYDFAATYQNAVTHSLTACFRCTPAVLQPALNLIAYNPGRLPKQLVSLYSTSNPPVQGTTQVWSFQNSQIEARAIANSCQRRLKRDGWARDQIIVLIFSRRLQLANITRELGNLGLPYDPPAGRSLRDEATFRAVYTILRLLSHDPLFTRLRCVPQSAWPATRSRRRYCETCRRLCIANHQNSRSLLRLRRALTGYQQGRRQQ